MNAVAYIGNFGPAHSTENHVRRALEANGHPVIALQEEDIETWRYLISRSASAGDHPQLVMWTRTKSLADQINNDLKRAMLFSCAQAGVPTVGFHLDRWWGLEREREIDDDPFFRCSLLVTADGGHEQRWADAGIRHHWMPPAVSSAECMPADPDEAFASDIAFVGSWQPGYHAEWQHRPQLIEWLRSTFAGRVRFWPAEGQPAVRGEALRQLYASIGVAVGDSCLVPDLDGTPARRYWSDRIPETLGRGCPLIHPFVEGLEEQFVLGACGLLTWELGNWDELGRLLDESLSWTAQQRRDIGASARAFVLANHTYEVRMRQLWELLGL